MINEKLFEHKPQTTKKYIVYRNGLIFADNLGEYTNFRKARAHCKLNSMQKNDSIIVKQITTSEEIIVYKT